MPDTLRERIAQVLADDDVAFGVVWPMVEQAIRDEREKASESWKMRAFDEAARNAKAGLDLLTADRALAEKDAQIAALQDQLEKRIVSRNKWLMRAYDEEARAERAEAELAKCLCPQCDQTINRGHAPDCPRLRETPAPPEPETIE